ncbi:MAG: lyase family protein [Actinomycetota bacterium]|nr:lyase family protein [Actinomycetota bacterium]
MSDLFWPGDERAGSLMTQQALLDAMVAVEEGWLAALVSAGVAPPSAEADLKELVTGADIEAVATGAEGGGTPVIPLLRLLRQRIRPVNEDAATWLHRGLTSQDVVDTALMLCVRDVLDRVDDELATQVSTLTELADVHRGSLMVGRTLTQHAVPITFGLKASGWLDGILDAAAAVWSVRARLAVQAGGAAGTLAAAADLALVGGSADPVAVAEGLVATLAAGLDLEGRTSWHTSRGAVTRVGDALVSCTDAWGRVAADVTTLSRPEIGELGEPVAAGRGGSSTMPQKRNPVLSVLVRRAAIAAPGLGSTLHTASALAVDERPDGAWHAEWATLRTLSRYAVVAADQTTELLTGLRVGSARMRDRVTAEAESLLAERRSVSGPGADLDPATYLGVTGATIDAARARAATYLEDRS